jgi:hypothetical protein
MVIQRKMDDLQFKKDWTDMKNEQLRQQHDQNLRLREERKRNISEKKTRWMMDNIISRDQQMKEMTVMNL